MQVRLEVSHRKANVKRVVLNADTTIGRSADCNLRIASNEVSRHHCKISISETAVTVRDLGSSNGTYLNDTRIPANEEVPISPGSSLTVGPAHFIVKYDPVIPGMEPPGSTVELPVVREIPTDDTAAQAESPDPSAPPAETTSAPSADDPLPAGDPDSDDDIEATILPGAEPTVIRSLDFGATKNPEDDTVYDETLDEPAEATADAPVDAPIDADDDDTTTFFRSVPEAAFDETLDDTSIDATDETGEDEDEALGDFLNGLGD